VATASAQLDRPAVRERVVEVLRSLLTELGSEGALPMLSPSSHLDRDLAWPRLRLAVDQILQ